MRSPASFFDQSIFTPCFLPAVEMHPRTLWACHPVASMISGRAAPFARPITCRMVPPLFGVGEPSFRAPFLPALAGLRFGRGAVFTLFGALFFPLATFFSAVLSGVTGAPASATTAVVSWVSVCVVIGSFYLSGSLPKHLIHPSGASQRQGNSAVFLSR